MQRGLLVRRSLTDPTDLAYHFTLAPDRISMQRLVNVAGCRWAVEECFEQAKQIAGLDEYEVRSWHAWYRHITLSMFSHAMLSVLRSGTNNKARKKKTKPSELASLKFGNYRFRLFGPNHLHSTSVTILGLATRSPTQGDAIAL
ncbi:MAG: hypothetical protein NTW52_15115 [Planctomycetota bacterium]|nr:hypothetical protein [Planctomycetota bacterium]